MEYFRAKMGDVPPQMGDVPMPVMLEKSGVKSTEVALSHLEAGGWLPKWASPGYRDSMDTWRIRWFFFGAVAVGVAI